MTESKLSSEKFHQVPLSLTPDSTPVEKSTPVSESPLLIRPRTDEERAEDLYDDQGIRTKSLPSSRTESVTRRSTPDQSLPDSFSPLPLPDPRNRRTERAPWWRGPRKKFVKGVTHGK